MRRHYSNHTLYHVAKDFVVGTQQTSRLDRSKKKLKVDNSRRNWRQHFSPVWRRRRTHFSNRQYLKPIEGWMTRFFDARCGDTENPRFCDCVMRFRRWARPWIRVPVAILELCARFCYQGEKLSPALTTASRNYHKKPSANGDFLPNCTLFMRCSHEGNRTGF